MEKKIIIVKPGTLSAKDKEKLTKNGCVVVEHPFPSDVRIIETSDEVTGNAIMMSALVAVRATSSEFVKGKFADELASRIIATEKKA